MHIIAPKYDFLGQSDVFYPTMAAKAAKMWFVTFPKFLRVKNRMYFWEATHQNIPVRLMLLISHGNAINVFTPAGDLICAMAPWMSFLGITYGSGIGLTNAMALPMSCLCTAHGTEMNSYVPWLNSLIFAVDTKFTIT